MKYLGFSLALLLCVACGDSMLASSDAAESSAPGSAGSAGSAAGSAGSAGGDFASGQGGTSEGPPEESACKQCQQTLCQANDCECVQRECLAGCEELVGCSKSDSGGGAAGSGLAGGPGGGAAGASNGGAAGQSGGAGGTSNAGGSASGQPERCTNGQDDNSDSAVDCNDSQCQANCADMCADTPWLLLGVDPGSLIGHKSKTAVKCAPSAKVGPSITYQYQAKSDGRLRVRLTSASDLILSSHGEECDASTGLWLCRNEVGSGGTETLDVDMKIEDTAFIVVTAPSQAESGATYTIEATFDENTCGDGKVAPGENCDDGNNTDGDGCSANCKDIEACADATAIQDVFLVNNTVQQPVALKGPTKLTEVVSSSCASLSASGKESIYSIRAALSGRLEAVVTPDNPAEDLVLSVRASCNAADELFCIDHGKKGNERVSIEAEAGRQYYLVVESYDGQAIGPFTIQAQTLPVSCGDGYLTPTVEQCDFKDESEKNCLTTCMRPLADNPSSPPPGSGVVVLGAGVPASNQVYPAGDADTYTFTIQEPMRLVIRSPSDSYDDCKDNRIDSQLELLDADGNLLGYNDDGDGIGRCSALDVGPGSYLARVRASEAYAPRQVFTYRIELVAP